MQKCEKERQVRTTGGGKKKKWEVGKTTQAGCEDGLVTRRRAVWRASTKIQDVTSQKIIFLVSTAERTSHFKMGTVQAEAQEQRKETGSEERKARENGRRRTGEWGENKKNTIDRQENEADGTIKKFEERNLKSGLQQNIASRS